MREVLKHIQIAKLFFRGKIDSCTDEQLTKLNVWLNSSDKNKELYNSFKFRTGCEISSEEKQVAWANIVSRIDKQKKKIRLFRISAAASVMILLGVGIAFMNMEPTIDALEKQKLNVEHILANKKVENTLLILSSGEMIELEENGQTEQLFETNGVTVKLKDGILIYSTEAISSEEILYNTVVTPRGKTQQLSLADGTQIWVNADSQVSFSVAQCTNLRSVDLNGEAYFDVTHNPNQPFHVKVGDYTVEVLGTSFNVYAYASDNFSATTLVKGKVKVDFENDVDNVLLKPNEQIWMNRDQNEIKLKRLAHLDVDSWRHGRFVFRNVALSTILSSISRWYDVNVQFEEQMLKKSLFTMNIEKYENVENVLTLLNSTNKINLELSNNTIIVSIK